MEKSVHVHPDEVIQFVDAIRTERLQPMHPELLLAPPLGVRPLWVVVNNHRCHVFPPMTIEIEMLSDWLMDFFGSDGRTMVIDSSAEVSRFSNILFLTNFATDEVDTIICLTRQVPKDSVATTCNGALKTVRVRTMLTKKTSSVRTSSKASVR